MQSGQLAEAERAFEAVLAEAPHDVEALNVVALGALRIGRTERAIELLSRALTADAGDATSRFHLGKAYEACADFESACDAYRRAVLAQPEFFVGRLSYASTLERLGRADSALVHYARALKDAQSQGRWLNPATTPAPLRGAVEHAVRTFRRGRKHLFARVIEPLRVRFGTTALNRVEKCLRVYLREEPLVHADPRQQPTFLYFPDLPASPYLERDALPWVEAFESQFAAIRAELDALLASDQGRERVFSTSELERQNLRGGRAVPSWDGYYFWRHGQRRMENCARCPITAAALEYLPLARVRGHAPEVLHSVFTPGTHLLPHRGVTNTRIVAHLPLIVPTDSALVVGGETHVWQEGRVVAFDDTYEHEAWNRSDSIRIVMIIDVWNPHLSEVERSAVAELVGAIGDLREIIAEA
jgi:aspartate beta-hydroxylase